MDIEEVASTTPEKIITTKVEISDEISGLDCEKIIEIFNLTDDAKKQAISLIKSVYQMFIGTDANMIEINPLILTKDNKIVALDCKISLDDNALFKHENLRESFDWSQVDEKEAEAHKAGLNYIALEGTIGCMVNGAGLAMATMDLIKHSGGLPANFLDVGGGASAETVSKAFKILLSDKNVRVVLVNIFGGIMRCDVIAEGIVSAVKDVGIKIPIVVRLEGTNVEIGKKILDDSKLNITSADSLDDAAKQAVIFSKA